ncbi:hypothetical protein MHF_0802 [Mycoplasma haemofelis Ohio2]|uniref:Uncharacterized protein n=1 Tax=Mycoplasma haemofelis (strain Ohio2) TaxID=859194 RepID=F6FIL8_MYCHI|nr:hypothetical protein MHF_0802 [Mycoplasma haemofelis Ohio2]
MLGTKFMMATSGTTLSTCSAYHYICTRTGSIGDALEAEGFEFIFKIPNQDSKRTERFKKAFHDNREFIASSWKSLKKGSVELINFEDEGEGEVALMEWCKDAIKQPVRAHNSYLFIFASRWCTLSMEDKLTLEGYALKDEKNLDTWKIKLKDKDVKSITHETDEDKKARKVMDYCHMKKDRVYYKAKEGIYKNLKQFCL